MINSADTATNGANEKCTSAHPASEDAAEQFSMNPDVSDAKATEPNTQKSFTP